jgi:DNA-directed RNA polymerase sigma subunit (sigma70/sigma32)
MQIDDHELMTFEEIGEKLGMTGQGARKIYRQAMDKMRRRLESNAEDAFTLLGQERSNTIGAQKSKSQL